MAITPKHPSPDRICVKYATKKTSVVIRQMDDDTILIEAPAAGLKFLGELFLAQASFAKDCGFQIDAGAQHFDASSEKGIYIHRLPCIDKERRTSKRPQQKRRLRAVP